MKYLIPNLLLAITFLSVSCTDDPTAAGTGDIWGYVILKDLDQQAMDDHSGVTVSLDGTLHSTTTAENGLWRLENVPSGVYTVNFAKPGITPVKFGNRQFVGNGSLYLTNIDLYELPTFTVTELAITYKEQRQEFEFVGQISEDVLPDHSRSVTIVYSTDPNGSFEATENTVVGAAGTDFRAGGTRIQGLVARSTLVGKGVVPGTQLYFRAFPVAPANIGNFDFERQLTVYTNLTDKGSEVLSGVMP